MSQDNSRKGTASLSPVPARAALDAWFLEVRSKLLDLAGALDRIGRGAGAGEAGLSQAGRSQWRARARTSALVQPASWSGWRTACSAAAFRPGR